MSDLGVRTEATGQKLAQNEDNLRLTESERNGIIEKTKPNEPSELWIDLRRQKVQLTNLAYSENLILRIHAILGKYQNSYMNQVDENVRNQLEKLVSGETTGWGNADKDKIFVQSGGERLATDSWH